MPSTTASPTPAAWARARVGSGGCCANAASTARRCTDSRAPSPPMRQASLRGMGSSAAGTLIAMRTTEPSGARVCPATCSTRRRTGSGIGGARKAGPSGRSRPRAARLGPGRSQTTPTISRGPNGTWTKHPGAGGPPSGAR